MAQPKAWFKLKHFEDLPDPGTVREVKGEGILPIATAIPYNLGETIIAWRVFFLNAFEDANYSIVATATQNNTDFFKLNESAQVARYYRKEAGFMDIAFAGANSADDEVVIAIYA